MKLFTKETIISELRQIRDRGWIPNVRPGNDGGVGNTLEHHLGITENNLPVYNAGEWELKCQRAKTSSLITLFHMEPSPRAIKFVPELFLRLYGWPHKNAGAKYPTDEMSFRQTISAKQRSDRGFMVQINRKDRKVLISFDHQQIAAHHSKWFNMVANRVQLGELDPQPYWGFDDLQNTAANKLLNCFHVIAEAKREKGREFFRYSEIYMLQGFSLDGLLNGLEQGFVFVDFDARTGHNHGTKFRLKRDRLRDLYATVTLIQ